MNATTSTTKIRPKEFHFPLSVKWTGERRVTAQVEGKQPIEITPPPVFRGSDPSTWSPEDFFVAAAASCLAVTFTGLAADAGLAYSSLEVDADGVAGMRSDDASALRGCCCGSKSRQTRQTRSRHVSSRRNPNKPVSSPPRSISPSRLRSK
jgi:organic hydroperoxide reductase OsmC/OhrA